MIFLSLSGTKECFTEDKQVFLLNLWDSIATLELISLLPLVGPPFTDPLAVKLLDNRLYICGRTEEEELAGVSGMATRKALE